MARDLFRMPKGVPREVARLIRTSTRRIPKPGQVLSSENAFKLYDALDTYRRALTRESRKAAEKVEKVRKRETRRKYEKKVAEIRKEAVDTERAADELERVEREVVAYEWELGIDYFEEDGWHHRKGGASDVGFNARILRYDGQPISETEAREAWRYFIDFHRMPSEIQLEAVSWRRSKYGRERYSQHEPSRDLVNFAAIMETVREYGLYSRPVRLGAVK